MRITTFNADPDGRSRFREIDINYEVLSAYGYDLGVTEPLESLGVQFLAFPAGLDIELHPEGHRQLVFVLNGELEIGTGEGELGSFRPGDVFLADDGNTTGHTTRAVGGPADLALVRLPTGNLGAELVP